MKVERNEWKIPTDMYGRAFSPNMLSTADEDIELDLESQLIPQAVDDIKLVKQVEGSLESAKKKEEKIIMQRAV